MTLDHEDIEAIADRVAALIKRPGTGVHRLLDPRELADVLNVSLDYIYAHAVDLGVMRLGDGPKARLRFDLHTAQQAMRERKQSPLRRAGRR